MPRGVPKKTNDNDQRKLSIVLNIEDYVLLEQLAGDNYRTPPMQASFLLAKVLENAGKPSGEIAEAILARARAKDTANGS